MGDNRRLFSDNEKMVLYNEVNGRCPICGKPLTNNKNGQIIKIFEVAHIYPANPRPDESELLKDEERLSKDVNSLDNVIAVCRIVLRARPCVQQRACNPTGGNPVK